MSNNDRIQLKREEVVGEDVVLSDINPKTNTHSIDDDNAGVSLDETIDRMWNAINNKLARVVNSWNGRTGAVIATADDVGLGNVDNVSFADIKTWVINRLGQEFDNRHIQLFNTLHEVDEFCDTTHHGDKAYNFTPFYSHNGYTLPDSPSAEDMRGWIGCIYWDEEHEELTHTEMPIDSIGWTDNSLIYNERLDDKVYNAPGGGLGVNIWKYEDALELYNDSSNLKSESGLRIKKEKIAGNVYYFDGVYGNGNASDPDALLYYDTSSLPADVKTVTFKIDDVELTAAMISAISNTNFGGINYSKQEFRINDIILCNFNDAKYIQRNPNNGPDSLISDLMNPLLMNRNPAIGKVTVAPTLEDPSANYTIEFYSIKTNTYRGLTSYKVHTEQGIGDNLAYGEAVGVGIIETGNIRTADDRSEYLSINPINVSGINAFAKYTAANPRTSTANFDRTYQTIIPSGMTYDIFAYKTDKNNTSATYILPNYSLCIIPKNLYEGNDDPIIPNWPMTAPDDTLDPCTGVGSSQSLIGVNLDKYVHHPESGNGHAVNISGLRVTDMSALSSSWFGDGETTVEQYHHSGGLSVNVGAFLEIGSFGDLTTARTTPTTYYDEGKVNVRIDTNKGLYDSGNNKIGVKLSTGVDTAISASMVGGLAFTSNNDISGEGGLTINPGPGIYFTTAYGARHNRDTFEPLSPYLNPAARSSALTIGISDTLNTSMYSVAQNRSKIFGGLRFATIDSSGAGSNSCVSIRVNNSSGWSYQRQLGDTSDTFVPLQRGTRGLNIDDENVLGIMLCNTGGNSNALTIKSRRAAVETYIDGKIYLAKSTMIYSSTVAFPIVGEEDRLYVTYENGFPEHYIWDNDLNDGAGGYTHFVELRIDMSVLSLTDVSTKVIYVTMGRDEIHIYTKSKFKTVLYPDINRDDEITGYEIGVATDLSTMTPTQQREILSPEMFARLNLKPLQSPETEEAITIDDVNLLNNFVVGGAGDYDAFVTYMQSQGIVNPSPDNNWYTFNLHNNKYEWVLYTYDTNENTFNVSDGAAVEFNPYGGIKNTTSGVVETSSGGTIRDVAVQRTNLEINISDPTSKVGNWAYDQYRSGGLRFGTDGVLAIRINNTSNYNNIDGSGLDNLVSGTKGLCIDSNNVLGIQVVPEDLGIDDSGRLGVFNKFIQDYASDTYYKKNTFVVDTSTYDIYLTKTAFISSSIAADVTNDYIVKIAAPITS